MDPVVESWVALEVRVASTLKEPVTNRLFELGAEGIDESEADGAEPRIRGFFPQAEGAALTRDVESYLAELVAQFPEASQATVQWQGVPMENWSESYKKYYTAQQLSSLFFLRPAWDTTTPIPEGLMAIELEPGQAFGTGLHPSTLLALLFLEWLIDNSGKAPEQMRVLDVGTGTGILAIAAAKLGVGYVEALDIDPIAVAVAKENAIRNQCPHIVVHGERLAKVSGTFDLVLSNILLDAHRMLAPEYGRLVHPGGEIVLAGLLGQQRPEAEEALRAVGLVPTSTKSMQEWIALSFVKASSDRPTA